MNLELKLVVEKHADGYVAYPLGLARGAVVGQGDTYEGALSDVRSALEFHVKTFGAEALAAEQEDENSIDLALARDEELESGASMPLSHDELMRRLRKM